MVLRSGDDSCLGTGDNISGFVVSSALHILTWSKLIRDHSGADHDQKRS